jgi:hypothetical protein
MKRLVLQCLAVVSALGACGGEIVLTRDTGGPPEPPTERTTDTPPNRSPSVERDPSPERGPSERGPSERGPSLEKGTTVELGSTSSDVANPTSFLSKFPDADGRCTFTGILTDAKGNPVNRANVYTIVSGWSFMGEDYSDATGRFVLKAHVSEAIHGEGDDKAFLIFISSITSDPSWPYEEWHVYSPRASCSRDFGKIILDR